jgi:hypothetical protein
VRTGRLLFLSLIAAFAGSAAAPASAPAAVAPATIAAAPASGAAAALPPIGHVWVIVLENEDSSTTYGQGSKAAYLAHTLTAQGAFVPNYYGIGHASLDNYIAMISGQGPNPVTQADCMLYQDLVPGTIGADGQASGVGCVYPAAVPTIADQLTAKGLSWRGYMEDIGNSTTEPTTCRHPDLNSQDGTQNARKGDQYAAKHDPFVYFHSIIDSVTCNTNVVALDRLPEDLRSTATTPNYSFITPNLCHDGHDSPCVDGQPGGLVSADQFLQTWVPQIVASPAYQQGGLLAIVFDEASTSDTSACCGEKAANTPAAGGQSGGSGGGKVGAVLLSPYIKPATVTQTSYNHYSLLRSFEDLFGLAHLGYAAADGLTPLGADVFTGSGPVPVTAPIAGCTGSSLGSQRGRLRRGALLAAASVVPRSRGAKPLLALDAAHATRVRITVVTGTRRRHLAVQRLRACHHYLIALPASHGRVVVTASAGAASEQRTVRF